MSLNQIVVLKFGSSVLRSEADLPSAVHEIYRHWRDGLQVIAVVSALGDTTDQLIRRAENICGRPEKSALASLLATGEATSSALLSLALNKVGIPVRLLDEVAGKVTDG
jgi:aspartokinase